MVCETCKNLLPQLLFKRPEHGARRTHHRTFQSLAHSKTQECYVCTLLSAAIPKAIAEILLSQHSSSDAFFTRCFFEVQPQPRGMVTFEAVLNAKVVSKSLAFYINAELFYPFDPLNCKIIYV
jgi:hypothetical protein